MLSIRKCLTCVLNVTNDLPPKYSISRLQLRLWGLKNTRGYAKNLPNAQMISVVRDDFVVEDSGEVKVRLDPRIEAVKDKLIYCDHIERKRLKYGYSTNKAIEHQIRQSEMYSKRTAVLTDPHYSIALKYLRNDIENQAEQKEEQKTEQNDSQNEEQQDKQMEQENDSLLEENHNNPIYMPYASTDQYESKELPKVSENEQKNDENAENLLNTQYKKLYEKYLDAKEATNIAPRLKKKLANLERLVDETEARDPSKKSELRRPVDSTKNVPLNWMTDYEQYNDADEAFDDSWELNYGTPDMSVPISKVPCGGCGALLHCQNSAIPGYLPSELFKGLKSDKDLRNTICQRCHFMKNYDVTLEVKVSPEEYPEILSNIQLKRRKAAVILMVDLTDFPCSIWPDLPSIIGRYTPIFVVGNKVDLLPTDCPHFLDNVKNSLMKELEISGIRQFNIKHVELISAETGFGVERLINKLHKIWEYKGDVYMIGCTNVGKSTLFNTLLQSDYCKIQAVDLIQRATTSPWPGTTLNLLKFPILNPLSWRLAVRAERQRMQRQRQHAEIKFRESQFRATRDITFATLQERIGRTFPAKFSLEGTALAAYESRLASGRKFGIDENDEIFKSSKWCYDTPGVVHPDQILHLLTTEELLLTLPKKIISPRSFIFKPGQTLFLAGLGRLDLVSGPEFIRITVFASDALPVTICRTENADNIYNELLQTDALVVPVNDPERLKVWPALEYKEFITEGIAEDESVCDILLSSAGWISITPVKPADQVSLRAWTPEGRGIYQRTPALLSKSIKLRGPRIKSSAAYQLGRQVYTKN